MDQDFCLDCGHLLVKIGAPCQFCGWSDRVDHLTYRGFSSDREGGLMFGLEDDPRPNRAELRV